MAYRALRFVVPAARGGELVSARRSGVRWLLDLREGIDLSIYLLGSFEPRTHATLRRLTPLGATVVDVGANIGAHTLHLASWVGAAGRVLAFEPTDYAVERLKKNLQQNPELEPRTTVLQRFLQRDAVSAPPQGVHSSWRIDGVKPEDARMGSRSMTAHGATASRLDDELTQAGVQRVGLVKLDVDGHELGVLEGGASMFASEGPPIVMELAPYAYAHSDLFDSVVLLLGSWGYSFFTLSGQPLPTGVEDIRRLIPDLGSINVVARRGPL